MGSSALLVFVVGGSVTVGGLGFGYGWRVGGGRSGQKRQSSV